MLADELESVLFDSSKRSFDLGNTCLNALCLNIEQSDRFLEILVKISELFALGLFRKTDISFLFLELLTKYHNYFSMVCKKIKI